MTYLKQIKKNFQENDEHYNTIQQLFIDITNIVKKEEEAF